MRLTKKKAIEEHRKMWNWIVNKYAEFNDKKVPNNNEELKILNLKKAYLKEVGYEDVERECFLCEYDSYYASDCSNCPLKWKDYYGENTNGCTIDSNDGLYTQKLYTILANESSQDLVDTFMCRVISEKIAALEER